jgi:aminomethyltransferase
MLISGGAAAVEDETLTQLRILEGTPLYGTDVQDKVLPQETGQTRALHFAKGCYLGQEIVERIRSRGNVHRAFTAFILAGSPAAPGTPIESESKPAGEITSTAKILLPGAPEPVQLALGYLRRETIDRNSPLTYPGGTATVGSIPFKTPIG